MFPPTVDERYCRKCHQPHQSGPHPDEEAQFIHGNSSALVYPAGSWKRKNAVVKFGRWKSHGRDFFLSQYFSEDEVEDLIKVATETQKYFSKRKRSSAR